MRKPDFKTPPKKDDTDDDNCWFDVGDCCSEGSSRANPKAGGGSPDSGDDGVHSIPFSPGGSGFGDRSLTFPGFIGRM